MKINKIIIVEPSPIICEGLSHYLADINQVSVVSMIDNIDDIHGKMLIHNADMIIINPLTLGFTNNSFLKQLVHNYPDVILVALITSFIDRTVLRFFRDSIELSDNKQKLVTKIINLLNNNDQSSQNDSVELSNREIDVLVSVAKGMTNKEISEDLNISVHTVISHRKNIIKKTGIKSVSGLTVYALLNSLIEESDIYE